MIDAAARAALAGDVVGLPTDTVYGIGAIPALEPAVAKLFEMKGRPVNKPVGLLVATVEQAGEFGYLTDMARDLATAHWPGALTLIVKPKVVLADWVGHQQLRTVGIRVPDHPVARELLQRVGPMAVTSANRSGEDETMDDVAARRVFGDEVAVYLPGSAPGGLASTVVDATGDGLAIIRQGPIEI